MPRLGWKLVVSALVGSACLVVPAAEATRQDTVLAGRIVPGKSIGPLKLGMSEPSARRLVRRVGRGSRLMLHLRKGTATEYVEYAYPYDYTAYTVGFLGRRGKRHLAYIATHVDENKTREKIGVSTLQTRLLRTYRRLACVRFSGPGVPPGMRTEYALGSRTRRHTLFVISAGYVAYGRVYPPIVGRVVVRERFERPEEHAKAYPCGS